MGRASTIPFLFDQVRSITTSDLKAWGYLGREHTKSGIILWKLENKVTGKMKLTVNKNSFILMEYSCNEKNYKYCIKVISKPSNLSIGEVWFFICPITGKVCRKLHFIGGVFAHRSSLPSGMYSTQTQSKSWRLLEKIYGNEFVIEDCYGIIGSKHFKTHYKGNPTKKYLNLLKKIKKAEMMLDGFCF